MLTSEGFTTAQKLSGPLFAVFQTASEMLGGNPAPPIRHLHYDWGIRKMMSVLRVAGGFLRAEGQRLSDERGVELAEKSMVFRALRDSFVPLLNDDDQGFFEQLASDCFPEVADHMPKARDLEFEQRVKDAALDAGMQPAAYFVQNVVDLQHALALRHCFFIFGASGCGKSEAWQMLAKVQRKVAVEDGEITWQDINPKAISCNDRPWMEIGRITLGSFIRTRFPFATLSSILGCAVFGCIELKTRKWRDGVLSKVMRTFAQSDSESPKWIIL